MLILLSINAENTNYDLDYAKEAVAPRPWYDRLPVLPNLPIREKALGLDAVNLIHFTNKRRAEQIALEKIRALQNATTNGPGSRNIYFFPVNCLQLSEQDKFAIPGGQPLFDKLNHVSTSYSISSSEDVLIAEAAQLLVHSRQRREVGWDVGPECDGTNRVKVFRLDDAFAFAMLRKQLPEHTHIFDAKNPDPFFRQWCAQRLDED